MNKILTALLLCVSSLAFAAEEKVVCIDKIGKDGKVVTGKDGKPQQDCKKMKVHKKLEVTPVPEKKK
jgi:hypothetical protein